jgi:D-arabinose 5-phosphate isomerase GutQ
MNVHTIAFTGNSNSSLAEACDQVLLIPVESEADDMNLAPTNSSTAVLMVGDAIACALSSIRNFGPKDFAVFHPAGALGRKLLGEKAV